MKNVRNQAPHGARLLAEGVMADQWELLFDEARRENGNDNHARAEELVCLAIREAERMFPFTRSYSSALCSFALWRCIQGRFAEAVSFQKRYIEAEENLGIGERELANVLMCLADMQQQQGKPTEAKQTIKMAIATYPPDYFPELSQAYGALELVLEELGDPSGSSSAREMSAKLQAAWDAIVESRKKGLDSA